MNTPLDFDELERMHQNDEKWFDGHPWREYRCRRSWSCETTGESPAGLQVVAILHRSEVRRMNTLFGAKITFETDISDAEIRSHLAALAIDPWVFLR